MILISAQAFLPASGGIENLMEGLARHAALSGRDVLVLADGGKAARQYDAATDTPYRVERFTGPRPLRRWLKARRIAREMRQTQIDAIYADTWKSLEALPAKTGDIPIVAYAHGNDVPFKGPKRDRIRQALTRCAGLIVVSADTLKRRVTGCTPEGLKTALIHPPAHPLPAMDEGDRAYAAGLWGDATPRLLCLCRLIDWKGVDQAIRAAVALGRGRLVIAGTGGDRARLEALADDLGAGDRVVFAGRVTDGQKTALLDSADVFLQPGRDVDGEMEGFGISYIEAALAGLPTISGKAGGAPEAIIDGETGFVVDGEKTDEVTAALRRLVDDEGLRARFAAAGKTHGEAALWPRQIDKILAVAGL